MLRADVIQAIGNSDMNVVSAIVKSLESYLSLDRSNIIKALKETNQKGILALVCVLQHQQAKIRNFATVAISFWAKLGTDIQPKSVLKEIIHILISCFEDSHEGSASMALQAIGERSVSFLEEALAHPEKKVRSMSARTLMEMGYKTKKVLPIFIEDLKSRNSNLRCFAAEFLGTLGEKAREALPTLVESLADSHCDVRHNVIKAIDKIGDYTEKIVSSLISSLADDDIRVHNEVIKLLGKICKENTSPLINALDDPNLAIRYGAARILQTIGEKSEKIQIIFLETLKSRRCRRSALWIGEVIQAIGNMKAEGKGCVMELVKFLQDDNHWISSQAMRAIGNIGKEAVEATPALVNKFKDQDGKIRCEAMNTLIEIGSKAVPVLIKALKNQDSHMHIFAVKTLGMMGHQAKDAIADLENLTQNADSHMKEKIAWALKRIQEKFEPLPPVDEQDIEELRDSLCWENNAWSCELYGFRGIDLECEIEIVGPETGPGKKHLAQAVQILRNLDAIKTKTCKFLEETLQEKSSSFDEEELFLVGFVLPDEKDSNTWEIEISSEYTTFGVVFMNGLPLYC